jgi:hypothetical protein
MQLHGHARKLLLVPLARIVGVAGVTQVSLARGVGCRSLMV